MAHEILQRDCACCAGAGVAPIARYENRASSRSQTQTHEGCVPLIPDPKKSQSKPREVECPGKAADTLHGFCLRTDEDGMTYQRLCYSLAATSGIRGGISRLSRPVVVDGLPYQLGPRIGVGSFATVRRAELLIPQGTKLASASSSATHTHEHDPSTQEKQAFGGVSICGVLRTAMNGRVVLEVPSTQSDKETVDEDERANQKSVLLSPSREREVWARSPGTRSKLVGSGKFFAAKTVSFFDSEGAAHKRALCAYEASLLRKLADVKGVVDIFGAKETPDAYTFILELGSADLEHWCGIQGGGGLMRPLPPWTLLDLWYQLVRSVAAFHARGVIHFDLKPRNVLVIEREPGSVPLLKVMDFGLARNLTGSKTHVSAEYGWGTLKYMAPEVIFQPSEKFEFRDVLDVWGLGIIQHQLLHHGKTPYEHLIEQNGIPQGNLRLALGIADARCAQVGGAADWIVAAFTSTQRWKGSFVRDFFLATQQACLAHDYRERAKSSDLKAQVESFLEIGAELEEAEDLPSDEEDWREITVIRRAVRSRPDLARLMGVVQTRTRPGEALVSDVIVPSDGGQSHSSITFTPGHADIPGDHTHTERMVPQTNATSNQEGTKQHGATIGVESGAPKLISLAFEDGATAIRTAGTGTNEEQIISAEEPSEEHGRIRHICSRVFRGVFIALFFLLVFIGGAVLSGVFLCSSPRGGNGHDEEGGRGKGGVSSSKEDASNRIVSNDTGTQSFTSHGVISGASGTRTDVKGFHTFFEPSSSVGSEIKLEQKRREEQQGGASRGAMSWRVAPLLSTRDRTTTVHGSNVSARTGASRSVGRSNNPDRRRHEVLTSAPGPVVPPCRSLLSSQELRLRSPQHFVDDLLKLLSFPGRRAADVQKDTVDVFAWREVRSTDSDLIKDCAEMSIRELRDRWIPDWVRKWRVSMTKKDRLLGCGFQIGRPSIEYVRYETELFRMLGSVHFLYFGAFPDVHVMEAVFFLYGKGPPVLSTPPEDEFSSGSRSSTNSSCHSHVQKDKDLSQGAERLVAQVRCFLKRTAGADDHGRDKEKALDTNTTTGAIETRAKHVLVLLVLLFLLVPLEFGKNCMAVEKNIEDGFFE